MEHIYHRLLEVIGGNVPVQSEMATVKAVDKDKLECTVVPLTNEELVIEEVNLKAVIDDTKNGFVQIPKIGSIVLISLIENTDGDHYVAMYSDIEEIQFIKNDKEVLKIDGKGDFSVMDKEGESILKVENGDSGASVTFHQGANKGLIKIEELKTQLEKNTTAIEKIIGVLTGWPIAPSDGGAALQTKAAADLAALQLGDFSGIENDKVKH